MIFDVYSYAYFNFRWCNLFSLYFIFWKQMWKIWKSNQIKSNIWMWRWLLKGLMSLFVSDYTNALFGAQISHWYKTWRSNQISKLHQIDMRRSWVCKWRLNSRLPFLLYVRNHKSTWAQISCAYGVWPDHFTELDDLFYRIMFINSLSKWYPAYHRICHPCCSYLLLTPFFLYIFLRSAMSMAMKFSMVIYQSLTKSIWTVNCDLI